MNATRLAYEDDELGVVYRVMAAVVLIDAISYLFHSFFSASNGLVESESVWKKQTKKNIKNKIKKRNQKQKDSGRLDGNSNFKTIF